MKAGALLGLVAFFVGGWPLLVPVAGPALVLLILCKAIRDRPDPGH